MSNRAISTELIELGERIRKRRQVMKLSLESFAEKAGISVNTVKKHKKEAYQYIRKILSPDIFNLFCLLFHPKD